MRKSAIISSSHLTGIGPSKVSFVLSKCSWQYVIRHQKGTAYPLANINVNKTKQFYLSFVPKPGSRRYALVICNHGLHPRGRAGDSRGNQRGFDQSFATSVRGKYPGFALYRQKGH